MLVWRDAMGVGHPGIDAANKQLIARINRFEAAFGQSGARIAIGLFLAGLYEEASVNFAREDKIHRECAFPFQDAHGRDHAALLRRVADLSEQYDGLADTADAAPLLRDLAGLVKEWVTVHIVQGDTKLRPYWQSKNGVFTKNKWG